MAARTNEREQASERIGQIARNVSYSLQQKWPLRCFETHKKEEMKMKETYELLYMSFETENLINDV